MKHFAKQNSSLCSLHVKIGIQMSNTVYTSKRKRYQFSSRKPSATKIIPYIMFITWKFIAIFLFEYTLMGILKPEFTRRNEIYDAEFRKYKILTKTVRKTQDRTSLRSRNFFLEKIMSYARHNISFARHIIYYLVRTT